MKINVPTQARAHFWEEPPPGSTEFWGFRWPPRAQIGDPIYFLFDGKVVAEAVIAQITPPGFGKCERTGGWGASWKVWWRPESFKDLRGIKVDGVRKTRPCGEELFS